MAANASEKSAALQQQHRCQTGTLSFFLHFLLSEKQNIDYISHRLARSPSLSPDCDMFLIRGNGESGNIFYRHRQLVFPVARLQTGLN